MGHAIWKYELVPMDEVTISMPVDAEIVAVDWQGPSPFSGVNTILCLWARVDLRNADTTMRRTFRIAGTGHSFDADLTYVGTATNGPSGLVFHVLEAK